MSIHISWICINGNYWISKTGVLLQCPLAAVQCIVIGPVCGCVCLWVCYHNLLEIACIDPHQTGSVGKGSDHLQLIKFWPSCAPGNGSVAGRKCLAPPYYSQRAVFAALWALVFILFVCMSICAYFKIIISLPNFFSCVFEHVCSVCCSVVLLPCSLHFGA